MTPRPRRAVVQDAAGIALVHVDTWQSTYRGIVPDERLSNLSYERSQRMWEKTLSDPQGTTIVAEDVPGHVVGFANYGPARDSEDFDGELYAIYVLQSMQGRGVGKMLVLSAAKDLKARSFDSMLVWVLAQNPFKRFYEKLKGEQVSTRDIVIGGKTLKELGYGWRRLDSLIARLEDDVRALESPSRVSDGSQR
jgi:ribosomal protein S18 acetylase RimI-like enzyme